VILATALGFIAGLAGLLLSFFFNLPSGPAIVLMGGALYLASLAAARLRAERAPAMA
jgi:zinc/manganese transport system permease protein